MQQTILLPAGGLSYWAEQAEGEEKESERGGTVRKDVWIGVGYRNILAAPKAQKPQRLN